MGLSKRKECSVSVGVCGEVNSDQFLSRHGAKEGDFIYVSGTLGLQIRFETNKIKEKKILTH